MMTANIAWAEVTQGLRPPTIADKVYKEECVYSFDNAERSPQGVYVNLKTFIAVGERHLLDDAKKTGARVYLRIKWKKVKRRDEEEEDGYDDDEMGEKKGGKKKKEPQRATDLIQTKDPWVYERSFFVTVIDKDYTKIEADIQYVFYPCRLPLPAASLLLLHLGIFPFSVKLSRFKLTLVTLLPSYAQIRYDTRRRRHEKNHRPV